MLILRWEDLWSSYVVEVNIGLNKLSWEEGAYQVGEIWVMFQGVLIGLPSLPQKANFVLILWSESQE